MGAEGSRESRRRSSEETERLMQQNFAIAQRLSNAQRADRSKNDGILFAMGQHMFANMKKQRFGGAGPTDGRSIEIEGITYDLLDFIGKGGFGEVYKAQMRHKDHIVAIKVMKNSASVREEIEDEIRFLSAMRNISIKPLPIIKYFGTKTSPETIHMAMELAACDLLKFWVDEVATADAERKFFLGLTIIVYVLRALTFLEKLEIIHGDIKPQNIVIVPRNNRFCVKLIDFGTLEKMDPFRAHLTVEADKPHTLFFASPEFIKRNEKNVMARRLHKTSDAWAAGVMFYFFLFERLPWKDQYEFDAFCNDPDAADIVVPRYGGFKHIIELLLKKNPEQRATAKATLMQVKDHPQLRNIIESLNEDFCPVYDVCHLRVSDDTRNELAKLARPGHVVRVVRPVHSGGRQRCKYGEKCFRHDRIHREDFAHPGDRDYVPSPIRGTGSQEIIPCRYASECHRFDTEHRQRYSHPDDRQAKVICRYGESCFDFDTNHRQKFSHPRPRRSPSSSSFRGGTYGGSTFDYVEKENCWFGTDCTDHHPEHRKRYAHPNGCDASRGKPACRYRSDCHDESRAHRSQYSHSKVRCHFGSNCNKMHDPEHRAEYGH